ncbi:hypothetical protein STPH2_0597 [Streptomyces sp. KO7888]|nr:hypothetical protein [Streptomyces sp. KO7888]
MSSVTVTRAPSAPTVAVTRDGAYIAAARPRSGVPSHSSSVK